MSEFEGITSAKNSKVTMHEIPDEETCRRTLDPIAVVGFSLEFPRDAVSPEAFWQMLLDGVSTSTLIPKDRFNIESFYDPDSSKAGMMNVQKAHFLKEDLASFDAPFFSTTPAEAACMDPQQRRLLETSYRALENAGMPMEKVAGSKTSVYIGSFTNDYGLLLQKDAKTETKHFATGTESGMLANRLSWFYDLKGPSMQLDTACSSSLNALHLACQSLRSGESDMGLVGGSNLFFNPESMAAMTDLNFLSPDGISYSFDARANGYSRGEGIGIVVIKLLSSAIRDGDTIRAVIRATGSNQDGRTPTITQPSAEAQELLIRDTYSKAGLSLSETRYFEAHGTGTPVGDPIEAHAINASFGSYRSKLDPIIIGTVKSNIGHLEGASGIAGLMKTILVLERGLIPKNIWLERVNPEIPIDDWNIEFPTENMPWPTSGLRRGSVNSFGFGGSNAHAIVDDACHYLQLRGLSGNHSTRLPTSTVQMRDTPSKGASAITNQPCSPTKHDLCRHEFPVLLVFSTFDELGISRLASNYQSHFSKASSIETGSNGLLQDLAYTLAEKRSMLPWRSFAVLSSLHDLRTRLSALLSRPTRPAKSAKLAFVFTGQGAHWPTMGQDLLNYPVFERSLKFSDEHFHTMGWRSSLFDELLKEEGRSNLKDPLISQPLCTALQIAIVQLFQSWKINPVAVVGHSSGEIGAAYCAGILSQRAALKVAYCRGLVAHQLWCGQREPEAMMAVGLSESEIRPHLGSSDTPGVCIACINSPRNVSISGNKAEILILKENLQREGIFARLLDVDVAYHSSSMNTVAVEYQNLLGDLGIENSNPDGPLMFSSLSGNSISADELGQSEYWVRNLTDPVNFLEATTNMCTRPFHKPLADSCKANLAPLVDYIVEIGPHAALKTPIKETLAYLSKSDSIGYVSVLVKGNSALESSLVAAGRLHSIGYPVDLAEINRTAKSSKAQMLTDLPGYPFDHSRRFWLESRLSKNHRFSTNVEHELLGTTVPDWNPLNAIWRKIIKLGEKDWLADHKFQGTILFPAAAIVIMAIEAARMLSDPNAEIGGFRVQDVIFTRGITLSSKGLSTEVETCLRPQVDLSPKSSSWWDFTVYLLDHDEWIECCHGKVVVEYQTQQPWPDSGEAMNRRQNDYAQTCQERAATCNIPVVSDDLYRHLESLGLDYGPSFKVLRNVNVSLAQTEATANVSLRRLKPNNGERTSTQTCLHPSVLDAIFQLTFPALSRANTSIISAMLPSRLKSLWITAQCVPLDSGAKEVDVHARGMLKGVRDAEFSMTAVSVQTGEPAISVCGFQSTSLQRNNAPSSDGLAKRLCYYIEWKPDFMLLDNDGIKKYCESKSHGKESVGSGEALDIAATLFMASALGKEYDTICESRPHLQRYVSWLRHTMQNRETSFVHHGAHTWGELINNPEYRDEALAKPVLSASAMGQLLQKVGERLPDILNGRIDALQLMFKESELLEDLYNDLVVHTWSSRLGVYLDVLAHKSPNMKILEIGAGTGSFTRSILDVLVHHGEKELGTPRFANYTFTDISFSFFEKAQTIFRGYENRVTYRTFNVEQDPLGQGFTEEEYDLVLACNVLHATHNLARTLKSVRKLLKPGGKLIILELSNPQAIRTAFIFGLLPGWWLSEEVWRQTSPLVTPLQWDQLLSQNGFLGTDIHWPDRTDEEQRDCSIMIATAANSSPEPIDLPTRVTIVIQDGIAQDTLAHKIKLMLAKLGIPECHVVCFQDMDACISDHEHFIFLPELEAPVLVDMTESLFTNVKKMLMSASMVVWVVNVADISCSLVTGLARTVKTEIPALKFVAVGIAGECETHYTAQKISDIYRASTKADPVIYEPEYEEREGLFHINRVVEADSLNQTVSFRTNVQNASLQMLRQEPDHQLALKTRSPGLLDTLEFVDDTPNPLRLAPDEMDVEVKASGLIFRDILIASGMYSADGIGLEYAGVVIGTGAQASTKTGDRVYGVSPGSFRTRIRCSTRTALVIPDNISFTTAVALLIGHCTAYHALVNLARIRKKESILIHSGAGGTGQATIQLAQYLQTEIFVTVGTPEKKRLMMEAYQIPEDHIFSSRTLSFRDSIKRITRGRGVDVILNSSTDDALYASIDCLAPFGRFIEIGRQDAGKVPLNGLSSNIVYATVDLSYMLEHKPELIEDLMRKTRALFDEKVLFAAEPLHIYRTSHLEDAFRYVQSGKNIGKVVVEMNGEDMVPIAQGTIPTYNFDPLATYVIAGGLGGIGRSIARWMVSRKARNLLLLSRNSDYDESQQAFLEEIRAQNVVVAAPPCDISSRISLNHALAECARSLPPIKGCIQSAVALEDTPFVRMSLDSFNAALGSKFFGTFNLHTLLPSNLSHFILLSSVAGIVGAYSQANYAAGNTYQDALARFRSKSGMHATSIDLGLVNNVGFTAMRPEVTRRLKKQGYMSVTEAELLALLDYHCNPAIKVFPPRECQVVTGLHTPSALRRMGMEDSIWLSRPLFNHLREMKEVGSGSTVRVQEQAEPDYRTLLSTVQSIDEARQLVSGAFMNKLAKMTGLAEGDLDIEKRTFDYGVDSLGAVEIQQWLEKRIGAEIPVMMILGGHSITELVQAAVAQSESTPAPLKNGT
ncbi:hypothetical protein JMJ35_003514 [Cladonia borealis]|uniref:Polyketide synthase n=1 Tax=Cladonia borealis TaxID=184061 RepID=A0AA39V2W7_9LECA|nr:hypothetical protein JMJ35_003514 [Cladonia borealis]